MTDGKDHGEKPPSKRPDSGVIIDAAAHRTPRVQGPETGPKGAAGLDFLSDVPLKLSVVLANTTMPVGEVLALGTDSVVQLDKPSGDPVDIYVGNRRLGKGEVVVLQEKLRIRVLEITPPLSVSHMTETENPEEE